MRRPRRRPSLCRRLPPTAATPSQKRGQRQLTPEVYAGAATSQAYSGVAAAVYGYRVRACNTAGCGPFSAVKSITRSPTAAPTVSTPAASLPGNYTVSWTAVTAATSYRLEEQVNGGGWAEVQNGSALSKAYAGKSSEKGPEEISV